MYLHQGATGATGMTIATVIGVLIIIVLGAILFVVTDWVVSGRLNKLLKILIVLLCIAAIIDRFWPLVWLP